MVLRSYGVDVICRPSVRSMPSRRAPWVGVLRHGVELDRWNDLSDRWIRLAREVCAYLDTPPMAGCLGEPWSSKILSPGKPTVSHFDCWLSSSKATQPSSLSVRACGMGTSSFSPFAIRCWRDKSLRRRHLSRHGVRHRAANVCREKRPLQPAARA